MIYQIYKMEFLNNVRFGKQSLNDIYPTLYADTLFSALYQEAPEAPTEIPSTETKSETSEGDSTEA